MELRLVPVLALAALVLLLPTEARAASGSALETALVDCLNDEREERGREPLAVSRSLRTVARRHSRAMRDGDFFAHIDPNGRDPQERTELVTRRYGVGENIAAAYATPAAVCEGWMESRGHRRNVLLRRYTVIGIGYARGGRYGAYYTAVFGVPRSR